MNNKYTFTCEREGSSEVFVTTSVTLTDLLDDFARFLRGCGFVINGDLDIINEDWGDPVEPYRGPITEEEKKEYNSFLDSLVIKEKP